ncbi:DHH family phosphoesterase [Vibrio misgurnus]|uniref:DHH family phosphoesterase n=1 Tax=Vibrio misgurnus TaxID=2993714 RepID=UPI0024172DCB|nr:DHH family phosphoesterase [Vibrio sp. gvc]
MDYDVFNGDADGILSLVQWRLANPKSTRLVTGVKRDIALLDRLDVTQGDALVVLDLSMAKNQRGVQRALQAGASVFYADHHQPGDIPTHSALQAHIDTDANVCTALIIDRLLAGRFREWAIAAAFGDNLHRVAQALAEQVGLDAEQTAALCELGTLINYNGYGRRVSELHFAPDRLYQTLLSYQTPWAVLADLNSPFYQLRSAYQQDLAFALAQPIYAQSPNLTVVVLPDCAAAQRVSGTLANYLANQDEQRAHLIVIDADEQHYTLSLRAPLGNQRGAGALCAQFASGGGRESAGGINQLPHAQLDEFIRQITRYYAR